MLNTNHPNHKAAAMLAPQVAKGTADDEIQKRKIAALKARATKKDKDAKK